MRTAKKSSPRMAAAVLLVLLAAYFLYRYSLGAVASVGSTKQLVEIPSGASVASIATLLRDDGLLRSSFSFSLYARLHGVQGALKAGTFVLDASMDVPQIVQILTGGKSEQMVLTIPEGYTVREIDALLAAKGMTKPGDILACARTCDFSSFEFLPTATASDAPGGKLEGYLFPDTYYVVQSEFVPKFFLERLLTTFRHRVVEGMAKDIAASKHSLGAIVTMASLVEAETNKDEERPAVAGILWKRLGAKMSLGVDASVRYGLDKPTGPLTESDLATASPYNLRKVRGLPPGPIGNPGLASMQAALHPKDSVYWYYLHDRSGVIHYAQTNDEHNQNRALYLP